MKATNKSLILLLAFATTLNACEMKRNLDEMHDSTKEMNETTREMNQTTSEMNKRTDSLETATGELYDALRQGDSLAARRAALDNMIKTDDPGRKLSEAAKYFMSYEFQFWMDKNQDKGDEKRQVLATMGAREFFKDIYQFIPNGTMEPDPFAGQIIGTKKSNLINCLNALSVTTHFLNPKQERLLKENPEMKPLSMYKMIEESLRAKAAIEAGEKTAADYPGFVTEVLQNEDVAVYLLEARYNYFMALFLGRATPVATSKYAALKGISIQWGRHMAYDWDVDLSGFNTVQIEEFNLFLTGALKTKKLLTDLGIQPRTASLLKKMFSKVRLKDITTDSKINSAKVKDFREIADKITELKKF